MGARRDPLKKDRHMSPKPTAFLFDLGRVVLDIDFDRVLGHWAAADGTPVDDLRARYTVDEPYRRHEVGALSSPDYLEHVRETLGLSISAADMLAGWNAIFLGPVAGIDRELMRAARHGEIYAFSNTNTAHADHFGPRFADVLSHFEDVFLSSAIGRRKPDIDAFFHVADAAGHRPETILFFDDSLENVEGARQAGMQAVHVTAPDTVPRTLDEVCR